MYGASVSGATETKVVGPIAVLAMTCFGIDDCGGDFNKDGIKTSAVLNFRPRSNFQVRFRCAAASTAIGRRHDYRGKCYCRTSDRGIYGY